jgi:general secretion pathway protein A
MVLNYYKLAEQPFGVTPDPRYLFLSETHREAMASALYGVRTGRGFTALIALPGMGKTTLLFDFLHKTRDEARTVFLFQSQCNPQDFLRSLLADLGIDDEGGDNLRMHRKLNECLLSESGRGKRLVVVLDEAQNLDEAVLELVRMLSNFETTRDKLMQVILSGQPQLAEKLSHPRLLQLRQRISIISRLEPFNESETHRYIDHRLRVAGYDFVRPMFTKQAQEMIASCAGGIPRNINNICFNAMSLGCVAKQQTIEADVVREVLDDLDLVPIFAETGNKRTEHSRAPVLSASSEGSAAPRTWGLRLGLTLALALALALMFNWPLLSAKWHAAGVLASPVTGTAASAGTADPVRLPAALGRKDKVVAAPEKDTPGSADADFVLVQPHATLCRIGIEYFGKCDEEVLTRFREVNPWLINPNHIEVGEKIKIPSATSASRILFPVAERLPAALASGAEKP